MFGWVNFNVLFIKFWNNCFIWFELVLMVGKVLILIFVFFFLMVILSVFRIFFIVLFRFIDLMGLDWVVILEKVNKFLISLDICLVVFCI